MKRDSKSLSEVGDGDRKTTEQSSPALSTSSFGIANLATSFRKGLALLTGVGAQQETEDRPVEETPTPRQDTPSSAPGGSRVVAKEPRVLETRNTPSERAGSLSNGVARDGGDSRTPEPELPSRHSSRTTRSSVTEESIISVALSRETKESSLVEAATLPALLSQWAGLLDSALAETEEVEKRRENAPKQQGQNLAEHPPQWGSLLGKETADEAGSKQIFHPRTPRQLATFRALRFCGHFLNVFIWGSRACPYCRSAQKVHES